MGIMRGLTVVLGLASLLLATVGARSPPAPRPPVAADRVITARSSDRRTARVEAARRLAAAAEAMRAVTLSYSVEALRASFEAGAQAYEEGNYLGAIERFLAAYEISPRPALLYNVAVCAEKLVLPCDAIEYFERYLDESIHARDGEQVLRRIETLYRACNG